MPLRATSFRNFSEAFASRRGLAGEKWMPPDWCNSYAGFNPLSTHDRGGVTELDLQMAGHLNQLAEG